MAIVKKKDIKPRDQEQQAGKNSKMNSHYFLNVNIWEMNNQGQNIQIVRGHKLGIKRHNIWVSKVEKFG